MAKTTPSSPAGTRHRRRNPRPASTGVLIVASIVASASANGYPLSEPPDFLCPPLDFQDDDLPGPSSVATPTPTFRKEKNRAVPDSYTKGDDGRYRKISHWEFNGSTVCLCENNATTDSTLSSDDLTLSDTVTATSSIPSTTANLLDSLPDGWSRDSSASSARTGLILSLSLVLALVISVFIVGCLYWRRKRRRRAEKDPERRLSSSRRTGPDAAENDVEVKTKSKLWAKASARWRDNVKQSARRRRNARLTSATMSQLNSSTVSLAASTYPSSRHSISSTRSPTPTPSSAIDYASQAEPDTALSDLPDIASIHPENHVSSPPAYQGEAATPMIKSPLPQPDEPSTYRSTSSTPDDLSTNSTHDEPGPQYTPPLHAAHVATDDKTLLHRMVAMGSAPPEVGGSHHVEGSAPALFEDDDEEFAIPYSRDDMTGPSIMFPEPSQPHSSSKGKMAAEMLDYEDLGVEPLSGPSAPPFDASEAHMPSAPPLDGDAAELASAPPIEEVDPPGDSAPPLDDAEVTIAGPSRNVESLPRYQP